MRVKICFILAISSFLVGQTSGACDPGSVDTDLINCLIYQNTYYQFPIYSDVTNLCADTTCIAYCLQQTVSSCVTQTYIEYMGNGIPLKTAYIGFCDQNETAAALSCAASVPNQDALNAVSTFQQALILKVNAGTDTLAVICADLLTMLNALKALINTACTAEPKSVEIWTKFLNTQKYTCEPDSTDLTFYNDYTSQPVSVCGCSLRNSGNLLITMWLYIILSIGQLE